MIDGCSETVLHHIVYTLQRTRRILGPVHIYCNRAQWRPKERERVMGEVEQRKMGGRPPD